MGAVHDWFGTGMLGRRKIHFSLRQQEILRLTALGLGDKEIAQQLRLSVRTVGSHYSRMFKEHKVHTRAAAVALWLLDRPLDEHPNVWIQGNPSAR